jgi:NAD(P)-dependent dehydrogenase (short-subunit alcohol dehydrogenase family)
MAYCQSKLAMVLFTNELARRLKNTTVTAVSVHPGGVRTRITRFTGLSLFRLAPTIIKIGYPIYWTVCKSAFEGSQTTIHCAVDENIPELSGKYFRY